MSYTRRTSADRKAEAAVFRARSEAASIPTVELAVCDYNKERKVLTLTSDVIGKPREFMVKSHHSGKEVRFVVIGPEDKLYDEDQWDGEQQIYRPTSVSTNVEYMVIYNNH
jgi:hypothetical protein